MITILSPAHRLFLLQAASTIAPEAAQLDAQGKQELLRLIEHMLLGRPLAMQRQFKVLLTVLSLLPLFLYGKTFETLDARRRHEFFSWVQSGPISLLRKGFWGLKAMIFVGYYGQSSVAAGLAYHPSRNGNEKLKAPSASR